MSKVSEGYPSDITDAQWKILQPEVDKKQGAGRPRELDLRLIINAILYVVRTGIQWRRSHSVRERPKDFPKWSSIYYYFRKWSKDGTWQRINEALRKQERIKRNKDPEPTGAILDSQSVKTTEAAPRGYPDRGFDAGKKINGRKRHVAVDTCGNLLEIVISAANEQDREGAKLVLEKLQADTRESLHKLWADGNYSGPDFLNWLHDTLHDSLELEITYRPPNAKGFVVVPFRWVVERTFAWLGRFRRLSKDYEHCTKSSEGVVRVPSGRASIHTMLKRLARHA